MLSTLAVRCSPSPSRCSASLQRFRCPSAAFQRIVEILPMTTSSSCRRTDEAGQSVYPPADTSSPSTHHIHPSTPSDNIDKHGQSTFRAVLTCPCSHCNIDNLFEATFKLFPFSTDCELTTCADVKVECKGEKTEITLVLELLLLGQSRAIPNSRCQSWKLQAALPTLPPSCQRNGRMKG